MMNRALFAGPYTMVADALKAAVASAEMETFGKPIVGSTVMEIIDPSATIPEYLDILLNMTLSNHPEVLHRSFQLIDRHMSQR